MKPSNHVFAEIPHVNIPRSVFNRNHNLKTTMGVDYLYPIYVDEALPGDTFKMKSHLFGRLSTPVVPIMDNLYLDTFFFAVPVRLVDDTFKRLMGERPFGDVRNDYTVPKLTAPSGGFAVGTLHDYLGLPIKVGGFEFCPWWHRAYNLIWNEWYRDENLQGAKPVAGVHDDGTVTTEAVTDYTLLRRGKRKDYFTGCLPWPQKGDSPTVALDGSYLPVNNLTDNGTYTAAEIHAAAFRPKFYLDTGAGAASRVVRTMPTGTNVGEAVGVPYTYSTSDDNKGLDMALVAHLNQTALFSINQLREAFAIQHLLERDALGGTRYTELVRAHFSVVSPDARQQRPEYLGGSSTMLNVTTVPQTSETTSTSPQANLSAFVTVSQDGYWMKSFTEHTLILGLANIRADLSYMQGLPRMFSRSSKYDFYWPALANLGEQVVFSKEIYCDGTSADDNVFGYQERWAEYRYKPNTITGLFRTTATNNLAVWHLGQHFANRPVLNAAFINQFTPIDRVLAVQNEPAIILDGYFELTCARPMPVYSVPGLTRL